MCLVCLCRWFFSNLQRNSEESQSWAQFASPANGKWIRLFELLRNCDFWKKMFVQRSKRENQMKREKVGQNYWYFRIALNYILETHILPFAIHAVRLFTEHYCPFSGIFHYIYQMKTKWTATPAAAATAETSHGTICNFKIPSERSCDYMSTRILNYLNFMLKRALLSTHNSFANWCSERKHSECWAYNRLKICARISNNRAKNKLKSEKREDDTNGFSEKCLIWSIAQKHKFHVYVIYIGRSVGRSYTIGRKHKFPQDSIYNKHCLKLIADYNSRMLKNYVIRVK